MDHILCTKNSKHSAVFLPKQASLCTAYQPTLITICTMNNCPICYKKVLQHDQTLYYSCCCKYIHRNCSGLLNAQYEYVKSDTSWYCKKCIGETFPFNHIDDESIFLKAIGEISTSSDIMIRHHTESKYSTLLKLMKMTVIYWNTRVI